MIRQQCPFVFDTIETPHMDPSSASIKEGGPVSKVVSKQIVSILALSPG